MSTRGGLGVKVWAVLTIGLMLLSSFGGFKYAEATLPTQDGTWAEWIREAYGWFTTALHLDYLTTSGGVLYGNSGDNVTQSSVVTVDSTGLDSSQWVNSTVGISTSALYTNTATLSGLTAGRVPIIGVGGLIGNDADLTFSGDTLTATKIGATTFAGIVDGGGYAFNNIGAAGNDFGATNTLVATTVSGDISGFDLRINNKIYEGATNADNGVIYINYSGYANGVTVFRDLWIGNGKNNVILFIDGSVPSINFNSVSTLNVGAAGNDFGATNTLVATTFSGDVNHGLLKSQYRDDTIFISSIDDGHLDLTADVSIDLNGKVSRPIQAITLAVAATTIAATADIITLTGDGGGNTVSTITGGVTGQILTIKFIDALVTFTNNDTGAANTLDLSAAWTSSANDTMTLMFDGTSWFEITRSVN